MLSARLHAVDEALARIFGDDLRTPDIASPPHVARTAAEAANCGGRALAAAHQALDWPTIPHLALWHAATVLREHRGDGHVAALVAEEVDGLEANVLSVAAGTPAPPSSCSRAAAGRRRTGSGRATGPGAAGPAHLGRCADRAGHALKARVEAPPTGWPPAPTERSATRSVAAW